MTGQPRHASTGEITGLRSVRTVLDQADEAMRSGIRPGARLWPTGIDLLDGALDGGFRSGELVLVGGTEGSGKTTLAMQMARNAVVSGRRAVVFSYEHGADSLLHRLIALECATAADRFEEDPTLVADVKAVRRVFEADHSDRVGLGDALGRLRFGREGLDAVDEYASRFLIFEASSHTTVEEIAKVLVEVIGEDGEPPLVLVDYLQKVPHESTLELDEVARVTVVTETLKDLAMELDCPVVAITAADRESLGPGHRMRTRDLRGSSALAYEADIVLIVASKEHIVAREHLVYDLGSTARYRRWSVVSIEKNRHGEDDIDLELHKDFEHGRFVPRAQRVAEHLVEERVFTT